MTEIDERFERWTARLREILAKPHGDEQQAAFDRAINEMWDEDDSLVVHWDNCIDGCCPTGELLLSRLVHPQVHAHRMITIFPEFIESSRTHRAVVAEDTDQ
ncbi:hypothetical protein [Streptomyces sp. NPDC059874]|uniref:hypothetical protein n=1 Tax=Streptomyces sp. NPDC059874 TaxID=3346983 RepID=UPI003651DCA1